MARSACLQATWIIGYAFQLALLGIWDCQWKSAHNLDHPMSSGWVRAAAGHVLRSASPQQYELLGPLEVLMEIISAYAEEDLPLDSRSTWWPSMGWVGLQTEVRLCHCNVLGYLNPHIDDLTRSQRIWR